MVIREVVSRLLYYEKFGYYNLFHLPNEDKDYLVNKLSNMTGNLSEDELLQLIILTLQFLNNDLNNRLDLKEELNKCIDKACLTIKWERG